MLPVSLTDDDLMRLSRVCAGTAVLVAVAILIFRWGELQAAPIKVLLQTTLTAIGVPPIFLLPFSKLEWTRPSLAWLLGRRMVHGLWRGELITDFKSGGGVESMAPIPIVFVIKQTYFYLTIQSYTATQPAHSTLEALAVEPRSARAQLRYVFEMQRLHFGEDKITIGHGDLRLTSGDSRLEGHYWTNSPTRGQIWLELITRDCAGIDSFADAQQIINKHKKGVEAT